MTRDEIMEEMLRPIVRRMVDELRRLNRLPPAFEFGKSVWVYNDERGRYERVR